MKFATKPIRQYPPHLRHVATLPWEIKKTNFCRYSADMEENANNCILSAQILIPLRVSLCMLSVFMCFYQNLVLVTEYHVDC